MRRLLWLPVSLLVASACSSATEPMAKVHVETAVTPINGPLPLVAITTTVINTTPRAIRFSVGTCPERYRVETLTGEPVDLPLRTCSLGLQVVTVSPGEAYQFNERWDGVDRSGIRLSGKFRVIGAPFSNAGPQSSPVTVHLP